MSVHLIQTVLMRNGRKITRMIIAPPRQEHSGLTTLIGKYPDGASAYRAARNKGAPIVYLHSPSDFPVKMSGPNDTRGMSWWK
jgi:hypothetical protein